MIVLLSDVKHLQYTFITELKHNGIKICYYCYSSVQYLL